VIFVDRIVFRNGADAPSLSLLREIETERTERNGSIGARQPNVFRHFVLLIDRIEAQGIRLRTIDQGGAGVLAGGIRGIGIGGRTGRRSLLLRRMLLLLTAFHLLISGRGHVLLLRMVRR